MKGRILRVVTRAGVGRYWFSSSLLKPAADECPSPYLSSLFTPPLARSDFRSTQILPPSRTRPPVESTVLVSYQGSEPVPRISLSYPLRTTRARGTSHNVYRLHTSYLTEGKRADRRAYACCK